MTAALQNLFTYRERFTEIQEKLCVFHNKMKSDSLLDLFVMFIFGSNIKGAQPVNLVITDFRKSASAIGNGNVINLPSWFLFKYEDIPTQFCLHGTSDPRLANQNFLSEFATWMNGKITEFGLTSICRPADFGVLQNVILMLRDPELYAKAKDFIMGHEIAHLSHFRREQLDYYRRFIQEVISLGGITAGICMLFAVVSIIPVVQLTVTVGVSGVAIGMIGASVLNLLNKSKDFQPSLSQIEEEKKADLDSVRMLRDVDGGVYYFQTSMLRNVKVRNSMPSTRSSIDERGNNLNDKDHPLHSDRVDYLKRWKTEFLAPQSISQPYPLEFQVNFA